MQWQIRFQDMRARAVAELWDIIAGGCRAGRSGRAYLAFRPASVPAWGELVAIRDGAELPPGCELVTGESFHGGHSRDYIAARVAELTARLPVIGADAAPARWTPATARARVGGTFGT